MNEITGYEVIVTGGGPGGVGAAVAAARNGARTLLIERAGYLGGAATLMLVNPYMSDRTKPRPNDQVRLQVNGGIYAELLDRLNARHAVFHEENGGAVFDDEVLRQVQDELVAEAGVTVLFHASLYDVEQENGTIHALRLAHNSGPLRIPGTVFIDATGDGLLSAQAGAEILIGDEHGTVMPMTLFFAVDGIDMDQWPGRFILRERVKTGHQDQPPLLNCHLSLVKEAPNGMLYFNAVRIPGNPLDPLELSRAEAEGRRRAANYVEWMQHNVPGCQSCRLVKTGAHIGIRESRRVMGDYLLTYADWKRAAQFEDGIACCCYPVDVHGQQPGVTRMEHLEPGTFYQIPYRCLTPRGLHNALVASRCISADISAHSSVRVMPPVMCLGQAAGTAAALALPGNDVRAVDMQRLRQQIREDGGILEPPEATIPDTPHGRE